MLRPLGGCIPPKPSGITPPRCKLVWGRHSYPQLGLDFAFSFCLEPPNELLRFRGARSPVMLRIRCSKYGPNLGKVRKTNECQMFSKRVMPQSSQEYTKRFTPVAIFHRTRSLLSTEILFRRDWSVQTGSGLNSPCPLSTSTHTHSFIAADKTSE